MITKSQFLESIKDLPEEFGVDEIVERAILIEKINRSTQQIEKGEYSTLKEFKEKAQLWHK